MKRSRDLLAFVHIEKAAGTTLIHLLRRNFFLRYLDVRPLSARSGGIFTADDLRKSLRLNPFLACIGGHAVSAASDLETVRPAIRYVTLLRDPVARYLSQYRYWVKSLGKTLSFEQFLEHEPSWNFQTRKIAGRADLAAARTMLEQRFFAWGVVERFEEFLLHLRARLAPEPFDIAYETRNVGGSGERAADALPGPYLERIRDNNRLDLELYAQALEMLDRRASTALASLAAMPDKGLAARTKLYADAALRKLYYEPLTGLVRSAHGLPAKGSY